MHADESPVVLILEDDEGVAILERRSLERAGFRVVQAGDSDTALRHLPENRVDLILLDLVLPGREDGLDFYGRLRDQGHAIPVILVTGHVNEATLIKALRAGVRDCLTKSSAFLDYLPEAVAAVLEQVQAERRLARSEAFLASIVRTIRDALVLVDQRHCITLVNPAAEELFGYPARNLLGRPLAAVLPETAIPLWHPGDPPNHSRGFARRTDGSRIPVEIALSQGTVDAEPYQALVVRDVSDRIRWEEDLRRSEERYRTLGELVAHFGYIARVESEQNWEYEWVTAEGDLCSTGYSKDEFVELAGWLGIALEEDRPAVAEHLRNLARGAPDFLEFRVRGKDGQVRWLQNQARPEVDPAGRVLRIFGAARDVTDKHRLEEQFRQAQKMEAIGRLAGGIAHDFNNLLTAINGFSDLLLMELPPEHPLRNHAQEIRKAGGRATGLTRQLLAFSRKQVLQPQLLLLGDLLADMETMLMRLIGEDVDLVVLRDPDLGYVKADAGQMEQVLLNLVVNARDAMPQGGKLTLEVRNCTLSDAYAEGHYAVQPGRYVLLVVSDTGTGMDAATRTRLFEPFFTTKPLGQGTGLGLATVYGIVRQSGGHISVYSEPGRGSTFKIYLPCCSGSAEGPLPGSAPGLTPLPFQGTTILLAEDDEQIRSLMELTLTGSGCRVLVAADGQDALTLCAHHAAPIHLMITDVVMPGMSGRELFDHLHRLRPEMLVLFMSGYTDDSVVRHGVLEDGVAFLHKPFSPQALLRKVQELLTDPR